ncbi:MAG: hypothetical protein QNJ68_19850 [Microcoleaceae cyanobacterium MO_207.B10]|nr:hypothetical protein [Microcoleaceae cyanobacterium MO_207.B10]
MSYRIINYLIIKYSNVRWHALQIAGGVQELKALYYRQFILPFPRSLFPVPCAQRYNSG